MMETPGNGLPEGTRSAAHRIARHINYLAVVLLIAVVLVIFRIGLPNVFAPGNTAALPELAAGIAQPVDSTDIVNGIHVETGLAVDTHWELVRSTCTACHSAKVVTQNRADREGWTRMIRWMQKTQNLWDLRENEGPILDYLTANYAPQRKGRRTRLTDIKWYDLEP